MSITPQLKKNSFLGIPWQSSGWDSALSLPQPHVRSLVGELGYCKPSSVAKKKKNFLPCVYFMKILKNSFFLLFFEDVLISNCHANNSYLQLTDMKKTELNSVTVFSP